MEEQPHDNPPEARLTSFSLFDLMLLVTVAAVTLGAWAYQRGLGIMAGLVATPVVLRSLLVFKRRAAKGIATSPQQKARMVLGSAAVAFLIYSAFSAILVFWVLVGLVIGVISICTGASNPTFTDQGFLFLWAVGSVIVGLWLAGRWVRFRWERDTRGEP